MRNSHLTYMDPLIDTHSLRTPGNLFSKLQMILNHQKVDGVKFCFFIDGLDEYDGSLAEAINLIRRLLSLQRLKLCISSRHLPLCEASFGLNDWNRLKMEDFNSEDIKTFATDTFLWGLEPWLYPTYSTISEDFEQEISAKAQGIFLWVVFVVPLLKEGMAIGHRGPEVMDVLKSIPSAPEECFKRILFQHIRDQDRADVAKMVKVTLEACCSLPLLTYWFIHHRTNPSQLDIAPVPHLEVADRSNQMVNRLQSQCHGFFVVRKGQMQGTQWELQVNFRHRMVRDFFRTSIITTVLDLWNGAFNTQHAISEAMMCVIKMAPLIPTYFERGDLIPRLIQVLLDHAAANEAQGFEEREKTYREELGILVSEVGQRLWHEGARGNAVFDNVSRIIDLENHHGFVHQNSTIEDALLSRDLLGLQRLLEENFIQVTEGDYAWLRELDAVGYRRLDMATLLLEDATDTPWIEFRSHHHIIPEPRAPLHHCNFTHQTETSLPRQTESSIELYQGPLYYQIQELCGLGGILPASGEFSEWNGIALIPNSAETVAFISYQKSPDETGQKTSLLRYRIMKATERFCMAAKRMQEAKYFCDSFTIVRKNGLASPPGKLELVRMELDRAVSLRDQLDISLPMEDWTRDKAQSSLSLAEGIAELFDIPAGISEDPERMDLDLDLDNVLHVCALAAQLLYIGLVSFAQAHVGPLDLFFITKELREVVLLGTHEFPIEGHRFDMPVVRVALTELTCLSEMTKRPVPAFSRMDPRGNVSLTGCGLRHNLACSVDGLLETWGPGYCIPDAEDPSKTKTIAVGGGFVYEVDSSSGSFHWKLGADIQNLPSSSFERDADMEIGALVTENPNCTIDEESIRAACSHTLVYLDTYRTFWEASERQFGIQGGYSNIVAVFNQTQLKHEGRAVKDAQLGIQEEMHLLQFLECSWGLQVSLCTGVARRVPLRELVADLLPVFAKADGRENELKKWINDHDALANFVCARKFREWMCNLRNDAEVAYVGLIRYTREVLNVLKSTGVDRRSKSLLVAWPHENDLRRGVRIPCEEQSYWARILADSHQCATYAYITSKCLESNGVSCRGTERKWSGISSILETAVSCYRVRQESAAWGLADGQCYHVETLGQLVLLKARKDGPTMKLIATESTIPRMFQKRLLFKPEWREISHIREKQSPEDYAEQVLISAGDS